MSHRDGRQTFEEVDSDLDPIPKNRLLIIKRMQERGLNVIEVDFQTTSEQEMSHTHTQGNGSNKPKPLWALRGSKKEESGAARPKASSSSPREIKEIIGLQCRFSGETVPSVKPTSSFKALLESIRRQLMAGGSMSYLNLERRLLRMDNHYTGSLSRELVRQACRDLGLSISDRDFQSLFNCLDRNGDGQVSVHDFLAALKVPLNNRRRAIVELAFKQLDMSGRGMITVDHMKDCYDSSKSPEVIAKKKTPQQAYREFLEHFELGMEITGIVTSHEFTNYHTSLGVSVDDDAYFEVIVRNIWSLPGGGGEVAPAASTASRYVHFPGIVIKANTLCRKDSL